MNELKRIIIFPKNLFTKFIVEVSKKKIIDFELDSYITHVALNHESFKTSGDFKN